MGNRNTTDKTLTAKGKELTRCLTTLPTSEQRDALIEYIMRLEIQLIEVIGDTEWEKKCGGGLYTDADSLRNTLGLPKWDGKDETTLKSRKFWND